MGGVGKNAGDFSGYAQLSGAVIASVLLLILAFKFVLHPRLLLKDLAHPVVGSVVPTFAMATMVVSKHQVTLLPLLLRVFGYLP